MNFAGKNCLASKFSKTTIAVRFNFLLQVCPYVPPFLFAMLFIPSFNVWSGYFNVSLNLVADSTVWIMIIFVTQLL